MVQYKELCMVCKKNKVLITSKRQRPVCMQCQFRGIDKPITDPKFKQLFDIDPKLYEQNYFLRDIKAKYLRFGQLSDKQIEVFERVVKEVSSKPS